MWRVLVVIAVFGTACGRGASPAEDASGASGESSVTTTTLASTTVPAIEDDGAMEEPDEPPPEPMFTGVSGVVTAEELGVSWYEGCPVAVDELRRLELTHWDDTGQAVTGVLVLHRDHVEAIVAVFEAMFDARFAVHSMRPITEFDGDDNISIAANNTTAFNCREIDGSPGTWSRHAYGGAIDINPLVNPWVRGTRVDPPEGERYVDRTLDVAGLVHSGDVVTEAFAAVGWGWGGDWTSTKDYQHFSATGR